MKTTDKILIIVFSFLLVYTATVLYVFSRMGVEPSVLTSCVFAACTGELGICWRIWKQKDIWQQRKWTEDDMKKQKKRGEDDEPDC